MSKKRKKYKKRVGRSKTIAIYWATLRKYQREHKRADRNTKGFKKAWKEKKAIHKEQMEVLKSRAYRKLERKTKETRTKVPNFPGWEYQFTANREKYYKFPQEMNFRVKTGNNLFNYLQFPFDRVVRPIDKHFNTYAIQVTTRISGKFIKTVKSKIAGGISYKQLQDPAVVKALLSSVISDVIRPYHYKPSVTILEFAVIGIL